MSQAIVSPPKPGFRTSIKETIASLREEATQQFINGDRRTSSDRLELAGAIERKTRGSSDHD